jgi:hypothetical protein
MASEQQIEQLARALQEEICVRQDAATWDKIDKPGQLKLAIDDWVDMLALARAAFAATDRLREPIVFTTADGGWRCTVRSAQDIVCERAGVETRPVEESNRESNRAGEKEG